MILMHYFNRSYFESETIQWPVVFVLFHAEIIAIALNILHTSFFLWINVKAKQFHKNWTNIMSILYLQHIVADVAWLGQRVLLIRTDYTDPYESQLFIIFSYVRVCCVYQGLSILPILIIERYFATLLFSDYESKSRTYISHILAALLLVIGGVAAYGFHEYESSLISFFFVIAFNSLGVLGNMLLLYINKKYYIQSGTGKSSLRARYQIAENIKVCRLVNCIVFSMGGFNALICFTILLDNFDLSIYAKSLSMFAFDVSALVYSTVFPYVCMHYCKQWKVIFRKVLRKIFSRRRSVVPYTTPESGARRSSVVLRNTFGEIMSEASTETYFRQLDIIWK